MERFFQISAVILAGVAAYFLWNGNSESAFVAAVFGAVSFFLSVRFQIKERLKQRDIEREESEKNADDSSSRQLAEGSSFGEQFEADREQKVKDKVV
jgi:hypothetical protein